MKPEDLKSVDSKNLQHYEAGMKVKKGKKESIKYRDAIRKVAFGVNFALIGIENQETVNYALPLTIMQYDSGEYEKQKRNIFRIMKHRSSGLKGGEYLYGFSKESRLHPVVTFVIYSEEEWDGGRSLHDIIDFSDIPDELKGIVQDYKVNLIEIRKWKDTSVFKTDIRQVFDFIRCSKEKEQVKRLVINNPDYEEISEDAYDVMKKYANLKELKKMKREDGNMVNMAKGLQDWAAEEREEGKIEGITTIVRNMLNHGMSDADIMMLTESSRELLEEVKLQNNI